MRFTNTLLFLLMSITFNDSQAMMPATDKSEANEKLFNAIRINSIELAQEALAQGADVNARDFFGNTPLHSAATGNIAAVQLFLRTRAREYTDLHRAAQVGNTEAIKLLLQKGADVNALDPHENTPLHRAAQVGNTEAMQLLLQKGVDVNAQAMDGTTPLHQATTALVRNTEAMELLLQNGANVNARDTAGRIPLHGAAEEGDTEAMQLLLQNGAYIHARTESGNTPLHEAAGRRGTLGGIQLLLQNGADILALGSRRQTVLHDAIDNNHPEMVPLLIDQGVDVRARDENGDTALHHALQTMNIPTMDILFQHGADINALNNQGRPPLPSFTLHSDPDDLLDVTAWLMTHGAAARTLSLPRYQKILASEKKLLAAIITDSTKEANSILGKWYYGNELPNEQQKQELNRALPLAAAMGQSDVVLRIMSGFPTYLEPTTFELALIASAANGQLVLFNTFYDYIRKHHPDSLAFALEEALFRAVANRHKQIVDFIIEHAFALQEAPGFNPQRAGLYLNEILNKYKLPQHERELLLTIRTDLEEIASHREIGKIATERVSALTKALLTKGLSLELIAIILGLITSKKSRPI